MTSVRRFRATVIIIACAAMVGCSVHFNAETLGIRATMAEAAGEQVNGEDFQISKKAVFLLWGVLPVTTPSLEKALAGQLIDGDEVSGLQVHVRSRLSDLIVTVITFGVVVPRSVTFTGTVVKNP